MGFGKTGACEDPDECANDTSQNGDVVCGLNENGVLIQDCVDGSLADTECLVAGRYRLNGRRR